VSYLATGLVASDIPIVPGGSTTAVKFTGGTTSSGPGFWATLGKGLVAAAPTLTAPGGAAVAPGAAAQSHTTRNLLIGGGIAVGLLVLVLVLKKKG
jgi:hypothetical protein